MLVDVFTPDPKIVRKSQSPQNDCFLDSFNLRQPINNHENLGLQKLFKSRTNQNVRLCLCPLRQGVGLAWVKVLCRKSDL